jgi:hypothetical protein
MSENKTGKQIVDDFFKSLANNSELNQEVIQLLTSLYASNKLTNNEIERALEEQRTEASHEVEKSNS